MLFVSKENDTSYIARGKNRLAPLTFDCIGYTFESHTGSPRSAQSFAGMERVSIGRGENEGESKREEMGETRKVFGKRATFEKGTEIEYLEATLSTYF